MRRVSGVRWGGGVGVIGWAIVVGWLVGGRRRGEEGGREMFDRTKYLLGKKEVHHFFRNNQPSCIQCTCTYLRGSRRFTAQAEGLY